MATPEQFAARMKALGQKAQDGADRVKIRIAAAILSEVVIQTPVDTGRARGNWHVTLGEGVSSDTFDPFVPGEGGSTDAANATAAIAAGKAAMSDVRSGQEIHIVNNLPYIERLNDGWSAQAPTGFVQSAVSHGVAAGRGEKVLD